MEPSRFDSLARSFAAPKSRRSLLGGLAALAAGLAGGRVADAQVSQAQCGNTSCRNNPAKCAPGCVCCVYANGSARCRPPGTCSPGTEAGGTTTTTAAPTTTTTTTSAPTSTTPAPATTTTTTAGPTTTTTVAPTTTTTTTTTTTAAPTCVGIEPGTAQCATDDNCPSGQACINGGCFTRCIEGDPCTAGDECTGCFCDPPIEGGGFYCADFNYVIDACQSTSTCPPGSFCDPNIGTGGCVRPCPTL